MRKLTSQNIRFLESLGFKVNIFSYNKNGKHTRRHKARRFYREYY